MIGAAVALYLGSWSCERPSIHSGYRTNLTVSRAADGWLQFIATGAGAGRNPGLIFSIAPDGDHSWTLRNFDYPYPPLTGTWDNGTIVFAPPAPSPRRFKLNLSEDGRTMSYVGYSKYGFDIYRRYRTTTCTRG